MAADEDGIDEDRLRQAALLLGEMPLFGKHEIGDVTLIRLKHMIQEIREDDASIAVERTLIDMARLVLDAYRGHPPVLPTAEEALGIEPLDRPGTIRNPGPA